jgi:hypothetical protein
VTFTGDDVLRMPDTSRPTTVSVYEPSGPAAVFHTALHAPEVISGPRLTPLTLNCTPTMSGVPATALIVTEPVSVEPPVGAVIATFETLCAWTAVKSGITDHPAARPTAKPRTRCTKPPARPMCLSCARRASEPALAPAPAARERARPMPGLAAEGRSLPVRTKHSGQTG